MSTWKLAPAIAILSLVGCGPPAQEVEAPTLPDPDVAEPAAETPMEDDTESGDPDSGDTESDDSAPADTQPKLPPHDPERSCKGLSESTCKVTEGCAWSTTEDCIEQEAQP